MTHPRKGPWNGIVVPLVCVGVLGATDAAGHDTLYKIGDLGQSFSASTPLDERYQRTRGAALKGALDAWAAIVLDATVTVRPPPEGVNRAGEPLAGYDDFSHAVNRSVSCDAVGAGANQFVCSIAGEPCFEVPSRDDPALVDLACGEDLNS
jgi:hypothetical protein